MCLHVKARVKRCFTNKILNFSNSTTKIPSEGKGDVVDGVMADVNFERERLLHHQLSLPPVPIARAVESALIRRKTKRKLK